MSPSRPASAGPRFWVRLAAITAVGLLLRVGYAVFVGPRHLSLSDAVYYHGQANDLARGYGFVDPYLLAVDGRLTPSAQHPPLFVLLLGAVSWLGGQSLLAHQVTAGVAGAAGVVAIGLLARRLGGDTAGLVAAAIAAVHVGLMLYGPLLASETLYVPLVAVVLLLTYRLAEAPRWGGALLLGAALGLAVLTRAEAAALLLVVAVALLVARSVPAGRRLALLVAVAAVAGLVVLPWAVHTSRAFQRSVTLSTNADTVIRGANCDATYTGPLLGTWALAGCFRADPPAGDESVRFAAERHDGLAYARAHVDRWPAVAAARVGRLWLVFRPGQTAASTADGWPSWATWPSVVLFWLLQPLAVLGLFRLRRRGVPIAPLVLVAVIVTVVAALTYGFVRLRAPWDVTSIALAGVALAPWVQRARSQTDPSKQSESGAM